MKRKVIIIAEAGVNHNGDLELAKKTVDDAENRFGIILKRRGQAESNLQKEASAVF